MRTDFTDFHQGTCADAYAWMGAHPCRMGGEEGYLFRVWAPGARGVSVVGDFNFWNADDLPMERDAQGVWQVFSRFAREGGRYKFFLRHADGSTGFKTDPYARRIAPLPDTAGILTGEDTYPWKDGEYLSARRKRDLFASPMNVYEVHAGSWRRHEDGSLYTYDELAGTLVPYAKEMGYTHLEFLPLSEYPFDPSWGYQVTGYYAPTFRYGEPDGLRRLVDACHAAGIGVILDWVPAHFPKDADGLYEFDGGPTYELADPMMQEHPDWNTRIFDYGRPEVRSFLISNAMYWIREFHFDGLRVDAVASMLYLDYGRKRFRPNRYGGNQNLEAIAFLRDLNRTVLSDDPSVMMIAEESTAFPMVTKPDYDGGLGFNFKWNMGWMNDVLAYMATDPLFRKGRHNDLTFSLTYAFSENFVLPLSHDEVVHGKKSLVDKMPGDYDAKFANLRLLLCYTAAHPGKMLTFMGSEFGQFIEWDFKKELDWLLLCYPKHKQMQTFTKELNRFYLTCRPLWENDGDWRGFQWISADDRDNSVLAFRRIDREGREAVALFNFCPVERDHYRIGLPKRGKYLPVFSSERARYGGQGGRLCQVTAKPVPMHGLEYSGEFKLPPLSCMIYQIEDPSATDKR